MLRLVGQLPHVHKVPPESRILPCLRHFHSPTYSVTVVAVIAHSLTCWWAHDFNFCWQCNAWRPPTLQPHVGALTVIGTQCAIFPQSLGSLLGESRTIFGTFANTVVLAASHEAHNPPTRLPTHTHDLRRSSTCCTPCHHALPDHPPHCVLHNRAVRVHRQRPRGWQRCCPRHSQSLCGCVAHITSGV